MLYARVNLSLRLLLKTNSIFSRVSFQHVKEPWERSLVPRGLACAPRVENKGLEPLTPSLQS